MSPLYEYRCGHGHEVERLCAYSRMNEVFPCPKCGTDMEPILSLPAKRTDGIYSYAPNIGSAQKFERHRDAVLRGDKLIDGEADG